MKVSDIKDETAISAAKESVHSDPRESTLDILMRRTGAPEKVALRKLEKLTSKGILEYGVSIRWSWPA